MLRNTKKKTQKESEKRDKRGLASEERAFG